MTVDLKSYDASAFERGRPFLLEALWRFVSAVFFQGSLLPFYAPKRWILWLFGAQIGRRVLIKTRVTITFPWRLRIGDYSWIGEEVWLDSLDRIEIGSNVCVSQRAYICTGSHDLRSPTFDIITHPVLVEDGAWIGAGASVAPGVVLGSHCFVAIGAVITADVRPNTVVAGNPAREVRKRFRASAS